MNNEDNAQFWEDIYLDDDAGWDLNGPTPVFEHLAESFDRGQVCIIGCGRGYDAVMFAKKGFDVTAVDFAPSAIRALKELIKQQAVNVNAVQQDIFSLVPEFHRSFDYIIEQTCFCAINPNMRNNYEKLVSNLLVKGGQLIGLWFPLDKHIDEGGPPWATSVREVKNLFSNNWIVESEEFSNLSINPRKDREKLIVFRKL